jgi:hypothetical protein
MPTRIDRAIRQLERIHQGDSAKAIALLREVIEAHRKQPTFNENRVVKGIEELQMRGDLSVQAIEAFAHKIAEETLP